MENVNTFVVDRFFVGFDFSQSVKKANKFRHACFLMANYG